MKYRLSIRVKSPKVPVIWDSAEWLVSVLLLKNKRWLAVMNKPLASTESDPGDVQNFVICIFERTKKHKAVSHEEMLASLGRIYTR